MKKKKTKKKQNKKKKRNGEYYDLASALWDIDYFAFKD